MVLVCCICREEGGRVVVSDQSNRKGFTFVMEEYERVCSFESIIHSDTTRGHHETEEKLQESSRACFV